MGRDPVRIVSVGKFACEALAGEAESTEHVPKGAARALRCYLHDRDIHRAGWSFPDLMRDLEPAERVEIEVEVDEETWSALGKEAARQGVSAERLLEHAMLYYAAEIDAGRLTERILDELDRDG
jgi:hypothetical protein